MKEKVKNILRDQVSIKSTKSLNQLTDEIDTLYLGEIDKLKEIIRAVRNIRSKLNVSPRQKIVVVVRTADNSVWWAVTQNQSFFNRMTGASGSTASASVAKPAHSAAEIVGQAEVFVPLEGIIDFGAERARLEKKLAETRRRLSGLEAKLGNEGFTSKAPAEVVERERAKAGELAEQVKALERNIEEL